MRYVILLILVAGCASRAPVAEKGAGPATQPATTQPVSPERQAQIAAAIEKGVAYLVRAQNPDGSWGTGLETRGTEVYSWVPGTQDALRVATTALCVMALREAGEKVAHDKGIENLVTHGEARRDSEDLIYNIWAHIYAVQALSIEMRNNPDPRLGSAVRWHLDRLARYETYVGGWNYYDFDIGTQKPAMEPTSFGTAAGLVALWEAKQAGVEFPPALAGRAMRRLAEMRMPNGAYLYGLDLKYNPRLPANMLRGSIGRNQACNFALWQWGFGKVNEALVKRGLDDFGREHNYIQMGRKRPYPHESWYQTAPYYYYFGHYYAALLVEKLGEAGRQYAPIVADGILPYQEPDGSWWDYAMWDYHKPYGTAFAVMSLLRCR